MIHLKIEEQGDAGIIRLDDEAQAFLDAGVDDVLIFDNGAIKVQPASGAIGRTFSYTIEKAATKSDDDNSAAG